jgi:hypothetical protein
MLSEKELLDLLRRTETHWIERKKSYHLTDVREAIVAFANSVPEGQHAVLFIGVGPDGKSAPVENADKKQRDIRRLAEDECFPPIRCNPTVVRDNGIEVIAVVVEYSPDRPHFAGHAFIRVGSETKKASQELLDELIASRCDKTRRILRDKGQVVTTVWRERWRLTPEERLAYFLRSQPGHKIDAHLSQRDTETTRELRVDYCDSHHIRFFEPSTSKLYSAPIENIKVDFDVTNSRTKLIIDNR